MADQQTSECNSTGTSSSSQSQSAPSSASIDSAGTAATLPTQDVVDGMSDEEELKISSWGRLFPLGTGFEKVGKCCFLNINLNTARIVMGRTYWKYLVMILPFSHFDRFFINNSGMNVLFIVASTKICGWIPPVPSPPKHTPGHEKEDNFRPWHFHLPQKWRQYKNTMIFQSNCSHNQILNCDWFSGHLFVMQ